MRLFKKKQARITRTCPIHERICYPANTNTLTLLPEYVCPDERHGTGTHRIYPEYLIKGSDLNIVKCEDCLVEPPYHHYLCHTQLPGTYYYKPECKH